MTRIKHVDEQNITGHMEQHRFTRCISISYLISLLSTYVGVLAVIMLHLVSVNGVVQLLKTKIKTPIRRRPRER